MSEELENNELSTSLVDAGQSVIPNNNAPVEEDVVEETPAAPAVEEAPKEEPKEEPKGETITAPRYFRPSNEVQALAPVADGTIGTTTMPVEPKQAPKAKSDKKKETVALYSTKNVSWNEAGKVYRGYNIVDKATADKWLTRDHIRLATPEEVAKAFGK